MNIVPIQVEKVSKTYRHPMRVWQQIQAVKEVSFAFPHGEIIGFVGHNGAGKTTMIKMLMGLITPTSGSIKIFGEAPGNIEVKKRIGFLPERPYFYMQLTGRELLTYFGTLSGIPKKKLMSQIDTVLKKVGLADAASMKLSSYSKGMLQRVGIAQAIIHEPELVVMDEPMSGLDPLGRHEVKELIRELKKEGRAVLFSSHILSDIENLSDKILIFEKGSLTSFGTMREIVSEHKIRWRVVFDAPEADRESIFSLFKGVRLEEGHYYIPAENEEEMNRLLREVLAKRYHIQEAGPLYPTLEELVFSREGGK